MARKRTTKALTHKTNWGLNDTVLPEDFNRIEGNIKQNEANQNTANSNHTALAARVTQNESNISKNKTDISTANSNHAALVTRVSKTENDISNTNDKIDNLKIGGRNLLKETSSEFKELTMTNWNCLFYDYEISALELKAKDIVTFKLYLKLENTPCGGSARITFYDSSNSNIYTNSNTIFIQPNSEGYTSISAKIPTNAFRIHLGIQREIAGENVESFKFKYKEPKLERGTIDTDWSQAPEDIQRQIDKNKTDISTANSNHTALAARVTKTESDISKNKTDISTANSNHTALAARVTKTESDISKNKTDISTANSNHTALAARVTQNESDISKNKTDISTANSNHAALVTRVSKTENDISNTNDKIDNLKIGGRNLLKETSSEFKELTMTNWNCLFYDYEISALKLKTNDMITFKLYLKFENTPCGGSARITFYDSSNSNIYTNSNTIFIQPNSEGYTSISAKIPANAFRIHLGVQREIIGENVESFKFKYKEPKLERGTIDTDWSQAPEDIQKQIDKNKNDIATANTNHSNLVKEYNKTKEQANDWDSFKKSGGTVSNKVSVTNGTNTTDYKPEGIYSDREAFNFKAGNGDNGMFISQSGLNPTGPMNLGSASRSWESIYLTGRSVTANGYIKLPNGMVLQWGTNKTAANINAGYLNYNIAFPTTCVSVIATPQGGVAEICTQGYTNTSFAWNMNVSGRWFTWIALGY